MIPQRVFFTKGVGVHKEQLESFEAALRDAGLSPFNLVNVSSIFPPQCKKIFPKDGLKILKPGQIVYWVVSRNATNEPNRLIAASVGCALPSNPDQYGYLSEHHSFGETEKKVGEYAEDLAASMLATTLGIEFDSNEAWDERRKIYRMSGKFIRTTNVAQSAIGHKNGLWTTVIAAAVFC